MTSLEARHGDDEGFPAGAMHAWVEGQTRSGRYPNASEYVRDLIRRDQDRADKIAHLQRLVDEGLGSGVGERSLE